MAEKKLLLGDEAIALGAIHAGISGVYAYPGTPSTEITEFIQNNTFHLRREYIDATYNKHIVTTAYNTRHTNIGSSTRTFTLHQGSQVLRTITQ